MWLVVGADVELQGVDDGYQGSRFQVEVLRIACGKVLIQYKNFHVTDDPDSPLLTEIVDKNVLRPLPPKTNQTSWAVGEAVEAYYQDAWWIGFIRKYIAKGDTYLVSFGPGQEELNLPPPMLRTRQDYVKPKFSRKGAWKVYGFVPESIACTWLEGAPRKKQQDSREEDLQSMDQQDISSPEYSPSEDSGDASSSQRIEGGVKKRRIGKRPHKSKLSKDPIPKFKRKHEGGDASQQPRERTLIRSSECAPPVCSGFRTTQSVSSSALCKKSSPSDVVANLQMISPSKLCEVVHPSPVSSKTALAPQTPPESSEFVPERNQLKSIAYLGVLRAFHSMGNLPLSNSQSILLQDLRQELHISRKFSKQAYFQVVNSQSG